MLFDSVNCFLHDIDAHLAWELQIACNQFHFNSEPDEALIEPGSFFKRKAK